MATAAQMLTGGLSMIFLAIVTGEHVPSAPSARSLAAIGYLIVFGSIVGFTAYTWLLRNVPPALATSHGYVNPLVAVALGWFLGGEAVTGLTLAAAAVSIAGVAVVATPSSNTKSRSGPARQG
jgi:drug/metabolite transporter (DMT)-like permease